MTVEQGVASLENTVMNDRELRDTRTVKPLLKVPQNQGMAKTVSKEPPPKIIPLTRTQRKGLQRARSVQKMKGILQMLTMTKEKDNWINMKPRWPL